MMIVFGQYQDEKINGGEAHWCGLQGKWTCQQNFVKDNWHLYYKVIMDAARHVRNSSSPYQRHTYRYSPRSVGRGGGPCWRCPPRGWSRPRSSPTPSTTCTDTTSWNTPTSLGRIRVSLNFSAFGCDSSPRGSNLESQRLASLLVSV